MNQRGIATLFSMGVAVVLTILGSVLLVRSVHEEHLSRQTRSSSHALFLADGAVDVAIDNLRGGQFGDIPTTSMSGGSYWAQVLDPTEDLSLSASQYRIQSHGLHQSQQRDIEAITALTPQSVFQFALFGNQLLSVSGQAITDSYDSSLGPYDPATAGSNGDIGTNSTLLGGVTLSGTYFIDGQIAVGPNATNPQSLVTGYNPAFVNGNPDVVSQSTALQMPSVSPPGGLACNTDLSVGGQTTVVLPTAAYCSGNACCIKNLSVSGGGTLTTSTAVEVYVTGAFAASGGSAIGVSGDPTQLMMILTSPQQATIQGDVSGNTQFYGALYSPTGDIEITGNAQIFGSVIAQDVEISGNAQVHYDEALTTVGPTGSYSVNVIEWWETQ